MKIRGRAVCVKKRFRSYDEAALALVDAKIARMKWPNNTKRREMRIYWCGECVAHHLTSKPERRYAQ